MAKDAEIKLVLNTQQAIKEAEAFAPKLEKALSVKGSLKGVEAFQQALHKLAEDKSLLDKSGNLKGAFNAKNLEKYEERYKQLFELANQWETKSVRLRELGIKDDGSGLASLRGKIGATTKYGGDVAKVKENYAEANKLLAERNELETVFATLYAKQENAFTKMRDGVLGINAVEKDHKDKVTAINDKYDEAVAKTKSVADNEQQASQSADQLHRAEEEVASTATSTSDAVDKTTKNLNEATKSASDLQEKLKETNTPKEDISTQKVAETKDKYEELRDTVIMLKADVMQVNDTMAADPAKDNLLELIRRYRTLSDAKKQMESIGVQTNDLDGTYATTVRLLTQLTDQIKAYKNSLSGTQSINEKSKKSTDNFSSALKGLNSTIKSIKSGFKSLSHSSNSVKSSFDKMANSMRSNFKHMITSLTKYVLGFRSLFFLVRRLRKYIGEGIQNMAQFNDGNNHVNESITRLLSSLLFLKNAWATAFSPILQFVTPILENLIDTLAEVGNAFSRFIGGLLGQTTVFQAVKVDAQDYADSLDKAAGSAGSAADKTKKLTDRLAAFDDLNVLGVDNDPDGTGSGGGGGSADAYLPDPNEMFKLVEVDNKHFIEAVKAMWEKADFSELGKSIKEKIMGALESIKWEEDVYPTVRKIMSSLGTFIVGLFGDPLFWEDLGDFGAGFFNAIIYGLQSFLETTEDTDFGSAIGRGLNKFLTGTDWKQAGLNVGKLGKQIVDNLSSFIRTADKTAIASAISDFLKGVNIPELAIGIGKLILTAASVSIDIIGGIIVESALDVDNLSADQLAYITDSWTGLLRRIFLAVADAFTAGTGLGALLVSLIDPPKDEDGNTDWAQIGYDIADGILLGFGSQIKSMTETGTWFAENVCLPIINALKEFFKIGSPSKVMEEYGGYIAEGLLNGISALMPDVEQIFTNFKKWLEDTWYNIRTTAVSNFWTMKTKIVEAFTGLKDGIKNIINNGILPVVEGMINFLIDGLNSFIDRLNSIPDVTFKSPFTGEDVTLGIDLSRIGHVSIPRLAQGAVIPPNREFMAVLGDQSHGTNIEAPLDTIKQAVAEVLANNGNAEMIQLLQQLIAIVESKNLTIGDKEIGRANARYAQQQNRIRGVGF